MIRPMERSNWLSGLLIGVSMAVVLVAVLMAGAGTALEEFVIVAVVSVSIAATISLLLYLAYRFATGWVRRQTTERIVIGQIATVMRQNLPLATALALAAESERGWARTHLKRISGLLAQGMPLSQAVHAGYPDCSSITLSLILAGEQAGQLSAALDQAEEHLFERERRRGPDDVSVSSYLLIVTSFTALVVSGIMVAVVPKYKEIFKDFGTRLPGPTISLINLSEFFVQYGLLLLVPAIAVPWAIYLSLRPRSVSNLALTSRIADWFRWHTPGYRRIEFSRGMRAILQVMRLGVNSGMSLEPATAVAGLVDVNHQLKQRLRKFTGLLGGGDSVRQAARRAGLGEVTAIALAGGQRGNDMDAALRYAADYHGSVANRWWLVLRNLAWPVWTLIMGIMVGFVVIALFLPLVALINAVSS